MAMAFPSISLVLISLLLVATVPLSHCIILNGTSIGQVQISGAVFCTASGNLEPGGSNSTGAAGAIVSLTCDGNQTILAGAITEADGSFLITVNAPVLAVIRNITDCSVVVDLPIVNCTVLPSVGRLVAGFTLVQVRTGQVLGGIIGLVLNVARYVIESFVILG